MLNTTGSALMDRRNGRVFTGAYVLTLFAAPVIYVGVVQAALCNRLGTSASVANLPSAAYLFGNLAPFFVSWAVPHRREREVVMWSNALTAISCLGVAICLLAPLSNALRVAAVIGQGLVQGFSGSTSLVFMYQCLGRGTSPEARARTLKITFTISPIAAIAGSLGAQWVLDEGIPWLKGLSDFALLYLLAGMCMTGVAVLAGGFALPALADEPREPLVRFIRTCVAEYVSAPSLVILWLAYALWYSSLSAMPNVALYAQQALGRDPKQLSGLMMAIRFGGKSVAGYGLGLIALRWGFRAPLAATIGLLGISTVWAWFVPGYAYLLSFAMMGGGELGGAYFPNYTVSISPANMGARNLALLTLATPFASLGALAHGALADRWGFHSSFLFGAATAVVALVLIGMLPAARAAKTASEPQQPSF